MSLNEYIKKIKKIYLDLLNFIDNQQETDYELQIQKKIFDELKNKYDLILLFHLITKISNNHHRNHCFYDKIENILKYFKNEINLYFLNSEIYNIFKSNKRILLFCIYEKIITVDQFVADQIQKEKYPNYISYFYPEIKAFIKCEWFHEKNKTLPDNFNENRKNGENDSFICKLIREDRIDEFVTYCKKEKIKLNSLIKSSIYETNSLLVKMAQTTLIDYAAFFGSINIFKYLKSKKVYEDYQLFLYAIHGNNQEIINIIEKTDKKMIRKYCEDYLIESIKCHHSEIANYINNKYYSKHKLNALNITRLALKNYNFDYIDYNSIDESHFFYLIQNDYPLFVDILLKTKVIDINQIESHLVFILF